jgi:hypothetical protein
MGRKVVDKPNFLGGEISPLAEGRSDLVQHQWGAGKIKNWITTVSGQATRRPPSKHLRKTYTAGTVPAVMFHFYEEDPSFTGDETQMPGYVVEVSKSGTDLRFVVTDADGVVEGTFTGGVPGSAVYTKSGISSSFDIHTIQAEQYGTSMYFVGDGIEPLVLSRLNTRKSSDLGTLVGGSTSTTGWKLEDYIDTTRDSRARHFSVPYLDENITSVSMTINTATVGTGRTLTCSTAYFHKDDHVGAYFRVSNGGTDGYCVVTAVGGASGLQTTCTVDVLATFPGTGAYVTWAEGAWSKYLGWPKTIARYGQRMVMANTDTSPDTIWFSQVGDVLQMSCLPADEGGIDEPLNFTLDGSRVQPIKWMHGGKKLTVGTDDAEWVGQLTNDGTNLFVDFQEENSAGSNACRAVKCGHSLIFSSKKCLSELSFNSDYESYTSINLSVLADHIGTSSPIRKIQVQKHPHEIVWVLDEEDRLFGLTRDSVQKVATWHSHEIAGTSVSVIDILTIENFLFLLVKRTLNGTVTYCMERLDFSHVIDAHPTLVDEIFLDSQVTDSEGISSEKSTWTNLAPHLGSITAYVVAWRYPTTFGVDGYIVHDGEVTVGASGTVTINADANEVVVGLARQDVIRLLPFEGGDEPRFHALGAKRADKVAIRLYQSMHLKIGKNRVMRRTGWEENDTFEPIPFDTTEYPDLPTFTGVKEIPVPTGSDTDGSFALAMEDPWPCTILSVTSRVVANEV